MRKYWASISLFQRIIHLNEMTIQTYDLKDKQPVLSNRINY
ncbi:MAG: hypothetical protein SGJ00_02685 [bacterium]|nr:hypothetical protein [bacterium]